MLEGLIRRNRQAARESGVLSGSWKRGKGENMKQIRIVVGDLVLDAELNETPTAKKVWEALPIETAFSTWGDEIYFPIPVDAELEGNAREVVELGDLGYWPTGSAFCIFFGPTPTSKAGEIRPASAVNVIGRITGDARKLQSKMAEDQISVNRVT